MHLKGLDIKLKITFPLSNAMVTFLNNPPTSPTSLPIKRKAFEAEDHIRESTRKKLTQYLLAYLELWFAFHSFELHSVADLYTVKRKKKSCNTYCGRLLFIEYRDLVLHFFYECSILYFYIHRTWYAIVIYTLLFYWKKMIVEYLFVLYDSLYFEFDP